uniref:Uncharacterized protein n=1 Tax=Romanomermis culicivorax TaxID=13658 RepID=A0A915KVD6_ROMCU
MLRYGGIFEVKPRAVLMVLAALGELRLPAMVLPTAPVIPGAPAHGVPPPARGRKHCQDYITITLWRGKWVQEKRAKVFPPQDIYLQFTADEPFSLDIINTKITDEVHRLDSKTDQQAKRPYRVCRNDGPPISTPLANS